MDFKLLYTLSGFDVLSDWFFYLFAYFASRNEALNNIKYYYMQHNISNVYKLFKLALLIIAKANIYKFTFQQIFLVFTYIFYFEEKKFN